MKFNRRQFIQLGMATIASPQILARTSHIPPNETTPVTKQKPDIQSGSLTIDNTITTIDLI